MSTFNAQSYDEKLYVPVDTAVADQSHQLPCVTKGVLRLGLELAEVLF